MDTGAGADSYSTQIIASHTAGTDGQQAGSLESAKSDKSVRRGDVDAASGDKLLQ